ISIDGLEESIAFLDSFTTVKDKFSLIELLACRGGCVSGPGLNNTMGLYERRERLLSYAQVQQMQQNDVNGAEMIPVSLELERQFENRQIRENEPTEQEINEILSRTGKYKPEDELNCGACGYNSCREKAAAVAKGLAEVHMCIPFMRAKAESRAGLICQMTPNAILVVDKELTILEANPAAQQKFALSREVSRVKLESIIDTGSFREALQTKKIVSGEVTYPAYNLVAWQSIVYLEQEEVLIGIFSDITKEKQQREKLDMMTEETLEKAQEVINKQMRVAQEIAGLLGETTAETKVQLTKLMSLIQNESGKGR
ncbi:MAG TPA: (Fe-S)-binding protein, partial [Bacillota bacterium]|nr:(Fe-S)-binding protein [Bacillota bacterium]